MGSHVSSPTRPLLLHYSTQCKFFFFPLLKRRLRRSTRDRALDGRNIFSRSTYDSYSMICVVVVRSTCRWTVVPFFGRLSQGSNSIIMWTNTPIDFGSRPLLRCFSFFFNRRYHWTCCCLEDLHCSKVRLNVFQWYSGLSFHLN